MVKETRHCPCSSSRGAQIKKQYGLTRTKLGEGLQDQGRHSGGSSIHSRS